MRTRAFALIDLLVVIVIIAVFMVIFTPSLKAAKDQGKRVHCLNNARTLPLGWIRYAMDNDNRLVGGNSRHGQWVLHPQADSSLEAHLQQIHIPAARSTAVEVRKPWGALRDTTTVDRIVDSAGAGGCGR
jgi:type II secretory pathway pseudopilin PulG